MKRRINKGFSFYMDADLDKRAELIISRIAGNTAVFEKPAPTVAELKEAHIKFCAALANTTNSGRKEAMYKAATRTNLEVMLQQLGGYVMTVANGDEKILSLSGFLLRKINTPSSKTTLIKENNRPCQPMLEQV